MPSFEVVEPPRGQGGKILRLFVQSESIDLLPDLQNAIFDALCQPAIPNELEHEPGFRVGSEAAYQIMVEGLQQVYPDFVFQRDLINPCPVGDRIGFLNDKWPNPDLNAVKYESKRPEFGLVMSVPYWGSKLPTINAHVQRFILQQHLANVSAIDIDGNLLTLFKKEKLQYTRILKHYILRIIYHMKHQIHNHDREKEVEAMHWAFVKSRYRTYGDSDIEMSGFDVPLLNRNPGPVSFFPLRH